MKVVRFVVSIRTIRYIKSYDFIYIIYLAHNQACCCMSAFVTPNYTYTTTLSHKYDMYNCALSVFSNFVT